jgi:hypothetical protein
MSDDDPNIDLLQVRIDNLMAMVPSDNPCRSSLDALFQTLRLLDEVLHLSGSMLSRLESATGIPEPDIRRVLESGAASVRTSVTAAEAAIIKHGED